MGFHTELPGLPPPLNEAEFLGWTRTELPEVFVLGSLNRHITIHSQQCRAINLIQALMKEAGGLDGRSLAIVGAGFAGLTAAAFAVEKTTARVSVFEAAPRPLWIQDSCRSRWLHPGIYDWPYAGSLEPSTALPVLNWHSGSARDVASHVRIQWDRIVARKGLLATHFETEIRGVAKSSGGLVLTLADGNQLGFDLVVLAVGFGLETGGPGRVGYWNDADGLDDIAKGSAVLISGFGDGGLADVLRLCLPDMRQASLVELVRDVPAEIRRGLIQNDDSLKADGTALDEFYAGLKVEAIIKRMQNSSPALAKVTLSGKGHLYGTGSAILNRFLVSQLRHALGEHAFELTGEVKPHSIVELPDGSVRLKLGNDNTQRQFDHLVLRWGPEPAYPRISPLQNWKVGEERRKHWYDMPQSLDRTRVPLVVQEPPSPQPKQQPQDFLAYESSSRRWCLILQPPDSSINWRVYTKLALEASRDPTGINVEPLVRNSVEVLSDDASIRSIVRALCSADIVVADVTGYEPGLLLLLGIRAAVRRSITIACTADAAGLKLLRDLPFNLRELNLISFDKQEEGHAALKQAIRSGLKQSEASIHYLDLPVYDFIREDESDADVAAENEKALFLRPFDGYGEDRKAVLTERIRQGFMPQRNVCLESVIDQKSPRLAGQRLYQAIRHWKLCFVDLTWWRPNVMFELGVRLAASPAGACFLIDKIANDRGDPLLRKAGHENRPPKVDHLTTLFSPFQYDLDTLNFVSVCTGRSLQRNLIYETAARHFQTVQDHHSEPVYVTLQSAANVTRGHDDPLQAVDVRPLYAMDNPEYGESVRQSAFERLCAAWCYLADREEPHRLRPVDLLDSKAAELFRHFFRIGARLKVALALRHGQREERMKQRIAETEICAKDSGAADLVDLLAAWEFFRENPPWPVNTSRIPPADWPGFILDCETQLEQLAELESRFNQLANPACQLPLQGVQSDKVRLERAIKHLKQGMSS